MNKNLKISLQDNSYNFIQEALGKAILAETEIIQWKYAIFSLVQSIELILKERLRKEHEILIFSNIDNPKNTISLDLAIDRLSKIGGIIFSKNDLLSIETAKKWRNLITHYEFEFESKELKVVFGRLLGFLVHFNKKEFKIYLDTKIDRDIWREAVNIFEYATELYSRAKKIIEEEKIDEKLIFECPSCGYDTFVIEDEIDICYVCGFEEQVILCPDCSEYYFESECEEYLNNQGEYIKYCSRCYDKRKSDDENYYDYMIGKNNLY